MDVETVIIGGITIVNVFLTDAFYSRYKQKSECLKALKEAERFELDGDLVKNVENRGGIIPYAVITGNVKALSAPLKSNFISSTRGVIREEVKKVQKLEWNPPLRNWRVIDTKVHYTSNFVPFSLWCNRGLLKKPISVEIIEPLSAEELTLSPVHEDYSVPQSSLSDAIVGYIIGEYRIAEIETENMLIEDAFLTGVGKLSREQGKLTLSPPDHGRTYFLTNLSFDSLVKKVSLAVYSYKALTIVMGIVTSLLLTYLLKKAFNEIKRKLEHKKRQRAMEEARKVRRLAESSRDVNDSSPKCVICLTNPVEILILECGHACLCISCGELVGDNCPICRNKIERLVSAFLP